MSRFYRLPLFAALLALCFSTLVRAEDAAPPKEPAAKTEAKPEAKADEKKPAGDEKPAPDAKSEESKLEEMFQLPETKDVGELLKFIETVETFRPKSRAESIAWRMKGMANVQEAAKRILELDKDATSPAHKRAQRVLLTARAGEIGRIAPAEQRTLLDEIVKYFADHELTGEDVQLAMRTGMGLEYSEHPELSAEAYKSFAKAFAESKDEKVKEALPMLEGAARRANLMGNELVLKGNSVDGQAFDWAAYRGKVVLVDFWATWCGPCLAELPNVKKNYELYHEKGFDVIGISLDNDDKRLHDFLEKQKLPWKTLYESGAGWKNSNARYYGIMGIPTVILVNKEGKAISLRARGEELGKLLEKELGPAEPAKSEAKEGDAKEPTEKKAEPAAKEEKK